MKFISLIVIMLICQTPKVWGQEESGYQHVEGQRTNDLRTEYASLGLTTYQISVYSEISLRYAKRLERLKKAGGSRENKLKKASKLKVAKDREMSSLLSKTQFEEYLNLQRKQWKASRKE
ncbi:MAG: hypothetical protein ABJF11_10130 [Reichenbachiella sp.]|uniref:hypothetical protein n=1 Tax=Reichenbachiella sp. TaxID=2184521 RepID=UPI003265CC1C